MNAITHCQISIAIDHFIVLGFSQDQSNYSISLRGHMFGL